MIKTEDAPPEA